MEGFLGRAFTILSTGKTCGRGVAIGSRLTVSTDTTHSCNDWTSANFWLNP